MRTPQAKYKQLGVSLSLSMLAITACLFALDTITPGVLAHRLIRPLIRLIGFITVGLFAGQIIEALGWTRQFAVLARPFFRFSRLGNHCSAAFTTAFVSGAAANAMLLDFYQEGKISKSQVFLSNYVNQFPAFFLHLPTTMFIVLPLTGMAGALYFILTFLATLFRTCLFLIFGRIYYDTIGASALPHFEGTKDIRPPSQIAFKEIIDRIKKRLLPRIINILVWVIPIYTAVFIFHINGLFESLNMALSRYLSIHFMPVESLSVVILSFAAEFTSGFAAAGALMDAGVLTTKQTVIALLMGNVLAFPIRALRHQLPRYMGIFNPKMGLQLLLSGQFFRIISLIFVGLCYYWGA
ncbi:MAG TPA: nucleoside recognition protein [Desulfobacteraceae bacterium]|nr:nucleoside recognition protein [Desulfobacteraceae bacterium]